MVSNTRAFLLDSMKNLIILSSLPVVYGSLVKFGVNILSYLITQEQLLFEVINKIT